MRGAATRSRMSRISGKQDVDGALRDLGQTVRAARKAAGLSQEALADASGIDRSHMGKIERGERNVTLLNLLKIARAVDVKASDLLASAQL